MATKVDKSLHSEWNTTTQGVNTKVPKGTIFVTNNGVDLDRHGNPINSPSPKPSIGSLTPKQSPKSIKPY
jgi:hypothetical protein